MKSRFAKQIKKFGKGKLLKISREFDIEELERDEISREDDFGEP